MNLDNYRQQINEIDEQLTALFGRRMKIAREIAEYKYKNNLPVTDKTRERAVIEAAAERSDPDIENYTRMLYSELFALSKAYQHGVIDGHSELSEKIRDAVENTPRLFPERAAVACQGVEGAYSQHACDRLFRNPKISYHETWDGVIEAVSAGDARYGILPIENSTAGSVNKVYDLMKAHDFYIVRSVRLRIDHSLLAKQGTKTEDIREIYSHEQALNQCSDFLSTLPGARATAVRNTASAARMVAGSERTDVAAIASPDCCELYGLTELAPAVQNVNNNYTRFICISKDLEIYPGADRTSLMLTTLHRPGALYDVLSRFNARGINLLKLESRPVPERNFEFSFYFDIEASVYSDDFYYLLDELAADGFGFSYFGSYSEIV